MTMGPSFCSKIWWEGNLIENFSPKFQSNSLATFIVLPFCYFRSQQICVFAPNIFAFVLGKASKINWICGGFSSFPSDAFGQSLKAKRNLMDDGQTDHTPQKNVARCQCPEKWVKSFAILLPKFHLQFLF